MGWTEWLIILVVAALLFRARQFGGAVGRAAGSFREGVRDGVRGNDSRAAADSRTGDAPHEQARGAQDDRAAQLAQVGQRERVRLLAVLELPAGASSEQIRQAWRDLARVWHPDRFAHDPALQARATARLAEINAAYEQLRRGPARA